MGGESTKKAEAESQAAQRRLMRQIKHDIAYIERFHVIPIEKHINYRTIILVPEKIIPMIKENRERLKNMRSSNPEYLLGLEKKLQTFHDFYHALCHNESIHGTEQYFKGTPKSVIDQWNIDKYSCDAKVIDRISFHAFRMYNNIHHSIKFPIGDASEQMLLVDCHFFKGELAKIQLPYLMTAQAYFNKHGCSTDQEKETRLRIERLDRIIKIRSAEINTFMRSFENACKAFTPLNSSMRRAITATLFYAQKEQGGVLRNPDIDETTRIDLFQKIILQHWGDVEQMLHTILNNPKIQHVQKRELLAHAMTVVEYAAFTHLDGYAKSTPILGTDLIKDPIKKTRAFAYFDNIPAATKTFPKYMQQNHLLRLTVNTDYHTFKPFLYMMHGFLSWIEQQHALLARPEASYEDITSHRYFTPERTEAYGQAFLNKDLCLNILKSNHESFNLLKTGDIDNLVQNHSPLFPIQSNDNGIILPANQHNTLGRYTPSPHDYLNVFHDSLTGSATSSVSRSYRIHVAFANLAHPRERRAQAPLPAYDPVALQDFVRQTRRFYCTLTPTAMKEEPSAPSLVEKSKPGFIKSLVQKIMPQKTIIRHVRETHKGIFADDFANIGANNVIVDEKTKKPRNQTFLPYLTDAKTTIAHIINKPEIILPPTPNHTPEDSKEIRDFSQKIVAALMEEPSSSASKEITKTTSTPDNPGTIDKHDKVALDPTDISGNHAKNHHSMIIKPSNYAVIGPKLTDTPGMNTTGGAATLPSPNGSGFFDYVVVGAFDDMISLPAKTWDFTAPKVASGFKTLKGALVLDGPANGFNMSDVVVMMAIDNHYVLGNVIKNGQNRRYAGDIIGFMSGAVTMHAELAYRSGGADLMRYRLGFHHIKDALYTNRSLLRQYSVGAGMFYTTAKVAGIQGTKAALTYTAVKTSIAAKTVGAPVAIFYIAALGPQFFQSNAVEIIDGKEVTMKRGIHWTKPMTDPASILNIRGVIKAIGESHHDIKPVDVDPQTAKQDLNARINLIKNGLQHRCYTIEDNTQILYFSRSDKDLPAFSRLKADKNAAKILIGQ